MAEPTTATNSATEAPRVINVDKNAVYPKAIAELKDARTLLESVELKPSQISQ